MIETVAELLEALKEKEVAKLLEYDDIEHPVMIGDMYEGLTQDLLKRSLFRGLDLRVVSGKVKFPDGSYSLQMDAMIVIGDGELVPYTKNWLYPPEQVIAVVEVKKTLYSTALDEAFQNLGSLKREFFDIHIPFLRKLYRRVGQGELPADGDLRKLPPSREMLAWALLAEIALPVRIVFGYGGYKSESTLRKGFIDYLERISDAGPKAGYGAAGLPSLIVCGTSALVKQNGMPFSAFTDRRDLWLLYGSAGQGAIAFVIEAVWTRLCIRGLVSPAVFGDDMDVEQPTPLLFAEAVVEAGGGGWKYIPYEPKAKIVASVEPKRACEPTYLTDDESVLLNYLCTVNELDPETDEFWHAWAASVGDGMEESLEKLRIAGLVARDHDGRVILLTDSCRVGCHPDHGWVAGEDSTGRFTRWMLAATPGGQTAEGAE